MVQIHKLLSPLWSYLIRTLQILFIELLKKLKIVIEKRSGPRETVGTAVNPWPYD